MFSWLRWKKEVPEPTPEPIKTKIVKINVGKLKVLVTHKDNHQKTLDFTGMVAFNFQTNQFDGIVLKDASSLVTRQDIQNELFKPYPELLDNRFVILREPKQIEVIQYFDHFVEVTVPEELKIG